MPTKQSTWHLLKLMYRNPPYVSQSLGHFAGDMAILEEIGELSEEAVGIIKESLATEKSEIDLTFPDLSLIPIDRLPEKDKELLLNSAKELEGDAKLKILRLR